MNRAHLIARRLLESDDGAKDWLMDVRNEEAALLAHGFRNMSDEAGPDRRSKYVYSHEDQPFRVYVTFDADDHARVKAVSVQDPSGYETGVFPGTVARFIARLMAELHGGNSPFVSILRANEHARDLSV